MPYPPPECDHTYYDHIVTSHFPIISDLQASFVLVQVLELSLNKRPFPFSHFYMEKVEMEDGKMRLNYEKSLQDNFNTACFFLEVVKERLCGVKTDRKETEEGA